MTFELHIVGWGDFQHYKDRWPPWIKNYTSLLANDDYLALSGHRRSILHGLWLAYAMSHGRLTLDTRSLSRRLSLKVTTSDLDALNHAGFVTFTASAPLAERSTDASPHALARSKEETETEELQPEGPSVIEDSTTKEARGADAQPGSDDDIDFTNGKTNYLERPRETLDIPDHVLALAQPGILPAKEPR